MCLLKDMEINVGFNTVPSTEGNITYWIQMDWSMRRNKEKEPYIKPSDTRTPFLCLCERCTCNADDGPLRGVQHISRGRLGALDAVVSRQVPGQCVTRGRRESHWTQVTGTLLWRSPDQRPPLGLVLYPLHHLDGCGRKKKDRPLKPEKVCFYSSFSVILIYFNRQH